MTTTEIIKQYHEEVSIAVANKKGIIERGKAIAPIDNRYTLQLKAMLKAGTIEKEEYYIITGKIIVINDMIRRA